MVDLEERRRLASGLRRFASGQSTVDEFEALADDMRDDAAYTFFVFAWTHYDDFRTERLRGEWSLSAEEKRVWARWTLYLATDPSPYPWESLPISSWTEWVPFHRFLRRVFGWPPVPDRSPTGIDNPHWPFRNAAHLHEAESRYLARYLG